MAITFRTFLEGIANASPALTEHIMNFYVLQQKERDRIFNETNETKRTDAMVKAYNASAEESTSRTEKNRLDIKQAEEKFPFDLANLELDRQFKETLAATQKLILQKESATDENGKLLSIVEIEKKIDETEARISSLKSQGAANLSQKILADFQLKTASLDMLKILLSGGGKEAQQAMKEYGELKSPEDILDFAFKNASLLGKNADAWKNIGNALINYGTVNRENAAKYVANQRDMIIKMDDKARKSLLKDLGVKDINEYMSIVERDASNLFNMNVFSAFAKTARDSGTAEGAIAASMIENDVKRQEAEKEEMRRKAEEDARASSGFRFGGGGGGLPYNPLIKGVMSGQMPSLPNLPYNPALRTGADLVSRSYGRAMDAMSNVNPVDMQRFISGPQGTPTESKDDAVRRFFGGPR